MKKLFKKTLAGVIATALVITLAFGVASVKKASADGSVALTNWSFFQAGMYNPGEPENAGYLNSVVTSNGESITGWGYHDTSTQTQNATDGSNGFTMNIKTNGWDVLSWEKTPHCFNPWSIEAIMPGTAMQDRHTYKVTFKAKAAPTGEAPVKYLLMQFKTTVDGVEMAPYDKAPMEAGSNNVLVKLSASNQTFTYIFTNYVGGEKLDTHFMLGAFNDTYDYAGNDVSDIMTSGKEVNFAGTVQVSDFAIEDVSGDVPTKETEPPLYTTTQAPTQATTQAPTVAPKPTQAPTKAPETTKAPTKKKLDKVTKVKVKCVKKKTIKVTWKKVKNAKKYQIKVGNKTYSIKKKTKKIIKNKKFKKGKKIKVKVRATATGYKAGAWSKTVKKKITK